MGFANYSIDEEWILNETQSLKHMYTHSENAVGFFSLDLKNAPSYALYQQDIAVIVILKPH